MGKSQRNKGAGFEREVCGIFGAALGANFTRKLGQARDSGNDIDIGPLVVECKRRKTLGTVYGWLQQAVVAAGVLQNVGTSQITADSLRQVPIVVARQDGDASPIVILRLNDFLALTHDLLREYVAPEQAGSGATA